MTDLSLDALWVALNAPGHFLCHLDGHARWLPTAERTRFSRTFGGAATLGDTAYLHPCPRYGFERQSVANCAVLWVRSESTVETEALLSWSPKPTLILREGDTVKHTALWALAGELDPLLTMRLNKRLAHAIGTAKKFANPEHFVLTPPGARTDTGKVSQVVHMAEPEDAFYSAKHLAGQLQDAPDTKALYKARMARAA